MSDPLSPTSESKLKSEVEGMTVEISRLEASVRAAAKEKDDIQQSLANLERQQQERALGFESNVKALRLDKDGQPIDDTSSQDTFFKSIDDVLASNSVDGLKALVKELRERLLLQQAKSKKLSFELEMECGHVNILRKKEKGELLMKVEQEEEQITNALQRKLSQLQREKVEMEQALEQEQEFIVNRLQRQLELLRQSQPNPNSSSASPALKKYPVHTPPSTDYPPSPTISPGIIEMMRAEVNSLKMRLNDVEKDYEENSSTARDLYNKCRAELLELRAKAGLPVDQIETTYPSTILPPLSIPGSPALDFGLRAFGSTTVAPIGSLERRSRGSLVGSQHELGNWPRNDHKSQSRSVSSTRGSLIL
ncbi:hypothetical protein HDU97_001557 [Phlyctochytrium planicorne]|nr:hypothetical protein HDU97_001557 [Phlyctochytrium planicorne]